MPSDTSDGDHQAGAAAEPVADEQDQRGEQAEQGSGLESVAVPMHGNLSFCATTHSMQRSSLVSIFPPRTRELPSGSAWELPGSATLAALATRVEHQLRQRKIDQRQTASSDQLRARSPMTSAATASATRRRSRPRTSPAGDPRPRPSRERRIRRPNSADRRPHVVGQPDDRVQRHDHGEPPGASRRAAPAPRSPWRTGRPARAAARPARPAPARTRRLTHGRRRAAPR